MNEIQNQIYFYQCLKNVFFGISIFCLFVTLWIAYGRKRSEKLKGILVITVFLFVGSFVFVQKAEASVQEEKTVTLKMKEGVCLKYTKIYDRDDFSVFQNPETGDIAGETISEQAEQVMKNIGAVLEEAGTNFENAVKTTCFLADMGDFQVFNEVYAKYFVNKPARSCVAVKTLPKNVLCEVEVIAKL